ncbi:MAG: hypothetical protein J6Y37_17715 [Paludibacteraceae bacterium]|nr:hypothetical protein [Paludibacteraceae bacterium]
MKVEVKEVCNAIDRFLGLDPEGELRVAVSYDDADITYDNTIRKILGWSLVSYDTVTGKITPVQDFTNLKDLFLYAIKNLDFVE